MDYQKYYNSEQSPQPSAPATDVPVSSTASNYTERPAPKAHAQQAEWSTDLCDCFSNKKNCCITCWCPCITFGHVSEIVDKGSYSCALNGGLYVLIACVTGCACIYSCFYRSRMREQYKLRGSTCNDCLLHWFCECCALCQEYRELEHRGFDMTLGWHGNVERQNRGIIMAPLVEQGMQR